MSQLDIFKTLWGWDGDRDACLAELAAMDACGVEARFDVDHPQPRRDFAQWLRSEQLDYIAVIFTGGDVIPRQADTPADHLRQLARALDAAQDLTPRFINVLAGNDRWPLATQIEFFSQAHALGEAAGLTLSFETHRGSSLYSPWVTLEIVRSLPQLRFTTDISHWVLVCERLLNTDQDDLTPFIDQVHHIQARVGYDQGPQVPHPDAPEYAASLAFHQQFWAQVWRSQLARGYQQLTLTPEFGRDGYLHHLPFTNMPVADLDSLNRWMAQTERQHFNQFIASSTTSF